MKHHFQIIHSYFRLKATIEGYADFGIFAFLSVVICCSSCRKKTEPLPEEKPTELVLNIGYKTDNGSFQTEVFTYMHPAGYLYGVSKLEYFLSQISLLKSDSSKVLLLAHHYIDATDPKTNKLTFSDPPRGAYIGLTFNIGLTASQNSTNALPAETNNINMQWPEPMGGGYHFLKLEGYYKAGTLNEGYAMHLGTNKCLIPIRLFKKFDVSQNSTISLSPLMNVDNWFRYPYKFDFNKDGNYIMGNDTAMMKIAANGKKPLYWK